MRTGVFGGRKPRRGRVGGSPAWLRIRISGLGTDSGFTLIEAVVAIAVAAVVFTSLAYASTTAISSTYVARINQQATDLATQTLEGVRALSYPSIGHEISDLGDDPAVIDCDGSPCFGTGVGTVENLVILPVAGIDAHLTTATRNGVDYTVGTYVTLPGDAADAEYKRVTVVVSWTFKGQPNERIMSSLVSESNSGLPLPDYQLTPLGETTHTVNPGGAAAYGFTIVNQGAPEQFNISVGAISGDEGSWDLFYDDGDGVFNPDTDFRRLGDSTGDLIYDTGPMNPNEEQTFWVVRKNPNSTEPEGVTEYAVSAASVAQTSTVQSVIITLVIVQGVISPSATPSPTSSSTVSPTATPSPSVSQSIITCADQAPAADPDGSTSYTRKAYTLHNTGTTSWPELPLPETEPIPGTDALSPMYVDLESEAIPAGYAVPVYSANLAPENTGGRILATGGLFKEGTTAQIAEWRTIENGRHYDSGFTLRLWVAEVPGELDAPVSLAMQVFRYDTKTGVRTAVGDSQTTPIPSFTCDGWEGISFRTPLDRSLNLGKDEVLGVQVWNAGTTKVRIGYDHQSLPASLTVVEK